MVMMWVQVGAMVVLATLVLQLSAAEDKHSDGVLSRIKRASGRGRGSRGRGGGGRRRGGGRGRGGGGGGGGYPGYGNLDDYYYGHDEDDNSYGEGYAIRDYGMDYFRDYDGFGGHEHDYDIPHQYLGGGGGGGGYQGIRDGGFSRSSGYARQPYKSMQDSYKPKKKKKFFKPKVIVVRKIVPLSTTTMPMAGK